MLQTETTTDANRAHKAYWERWANLPILLRKGTERFPLMAGLPRQPSKKLIYMKCAALRDTKSIEENK